MNRRENKGNVFWVSIVAIMLSIVAICMVSFRWTPSTFDLVGFWGWTTASLSAIVVLLLGWNIYSLIDLNKYRGELEDLKVNIEKRISEAEETARTRHSLESMGISSLLISIKTNELNKGLEEAFRQFSSYIAKDSTLLMSMAREYILQSLNAISEYKEATSDLVGTISKTIPHSQIEAFYHEFASYTPEEQKRYSGAQNLLLKLLEATHRHGGHV